jgi:hypothetical protein
MKNNSNASGCSWKKGVENYSQVVFSQTVRIVLVLAVQKFAVGIGHSSGNGCEREIKELKLGLEMSCPWENWCLLG